MDEKRIILGGRKENHKDNKKKSMIKDNRKQKDFTGITFSKFKKTAVKSELIKSLNGNNIEQACFWCAEYVCSGHFLDLWDIIFLFIGKHIHIGNPKLPIYINARLEVFKSIAHKNNSNILEVRNNDIIRKLFSEIMGILCYSKKKNSFDIVKITKSELDITNIPQKLTADHTRYVVKYFKKDDPKELFIATNEFVYNIQKKNNINAFYWVEWILMYESIVKKTKSRVILGKSRENIPVEYKFSKDIIWILWDILLKESIKIGMGHNKIINSLLTMYCLKYKMGMKRKRKLLIYYAISILTEKIDNSIEIFSDASILENIKNNIDVIYHQIKQNEEKSQMDYLFSN